MNIVDTLFSMRDLKYKEFHSSLCPDTDNIIGVRIPKLKKIAKELYKNDKYVLTKIGDNYYEEIVLQGLIIALSTESVNKKLKMIEKYVPKIYNWAVCDTFCAAIKIKKKDKEIYFKFLKKYYESNKEFELRFLIVMLLDHYLEEEYLDRVFEIISNIKLDKYYVNMALAWLVSFSYIKFPSETLNKLDTLNLNDWTYNKAIQKIIESKRVSEKDKQMLRKLKK